MHQQLWGYKVKEKLYLGVRKQKRLNTAGLDDIPETVIKSSVNYIKKTLTYIHNLSFQT
jgi:hypothetical protein